MNPHNTRLAGLSQTSLTSPEMIATPHAAAMFQLDYARPENWSQLQQAVEQGWRRGGATLIELQVSPSEGAESLQYLVQQMAVQ